MLIIKDSGEIFWEKGTQSGTIYTCEIPQIYVQGNYIAEYGTNTKAFFQEQKYRCMMMKYIFLCMYVALLQRMTGSCPKELTMYTSRQRRYKKRREMEVELNSERIFNSVS